MHCLTNGGHAMGMTAVEEALKTEPRTLRHRLEHASRMRTVEDIRRLKRLGMMVTLLPPTAKAAPGAAPRQGRPYRTYVREGAEPICVTDATGTTPNFNPWVSIAGIVASPEEGGSVPAEETVSFDDALRMWTLSAAKGGLEEQHKGSIAVGKLGDFAVLSGDPRTLPGEALFDLEVDATVIGGRVVYERG
jgi:predicted amidohydrolase YtcJ